VTGIGPKAKQNVQAKGVILAAGVLGTLELLLRCRENGSLPGLSPMLGQIVRTNSEVLAGSGVIDKHHRVFGYDDMYVVDASAIPANLGVNPSLTITAMAERAISCVPPKKAG
jgi:choline dehydrogenase-like flavoprotein